MLKNEIVLPPRLFNARQPLLHGVAAQTHHVHHFAVAHFKQITGGKCADRTVIRRDGRQSHAIVAAVDQHAGLAEIGRQIVNMGIVNAQQNGGLRLHFIHAREK